jgi:hypothetical protein
LPFVKLISVNSPKFCNVENATDYVISRRTEGTGLATDNTFMQISTLQNFGEFTDINLTNGNKYVYLVTAKSKPKSCYLL